MCCDLTKIYKACCRRFGRCEPPPGFVPSRMASNAVIGYSSILPSSTINSMSTEDADSCSDMKDEPSSVTADEKVHLDQAALCDAMHPNGHIQAKSWLELRQANWATHFACFVSDFW